MDAPGLLHGFRLITLDTVGSTNDEAKRLAGEGAGDGTLIRARRQTAGRGRLGRTWVSETGNLYVSMILKPGCRLGQAGQVGFVAANAVADAITEVLPGTVTVGCKWPNDVLAAGRKVSGMLLESEMSGTGNLDWLIAGIGINVDSHPKDANFPATSLKACGADGGISADTVLEAFCRHFRAGYAEWSRDGFEPARRAWLAHAVGRGRDIRARTATATLEGVFEDVDAGGALVVREADGRRTLVSAGDVYFPEPPPSAGV
jgi:BirA family biotin operon repressor/biotin-[acetyl-CoA-carboxylase] ligase